MRGTGRWEKMNTFEKYIKMLLKPSLRDACRIAYGSEFLRQYDAINQGEPIGSLVDTIEFLDKVETVRKRLNG